MRQEVSDAPAAAAGPARVLKSGSVVLWSGLVLLLGASLPPGSRASSFTEPEGYGKAKFGMTEEQVKAVYPQLQLLPRPTPVAQAEGKPALLNFYNLEEQTVGPLEKCLVQFRFFVGKLYEVQFRCPDKDKVTDYLQRQFGLPTKTTDTTLMWTGTKSGITHVPRGGVFMYGDVESSQLMQRSIIRHMLSQPVTTPGAPAPAP